MRSRRKVVQLADARLAPVPSVVQTLEAMLVRAKAGEIRAVGIAAVVSARDKYTGWDLGDMPLSDLWFAVRCLENRMTTVG